MNKVKIVVDSTVDLSEELYKKLDLLVLPLNVNFGEETFKDGVDITPDEIYDRVEKTKKLPSTAAISPAAFHDALKPFIDDGYDIVFVGIGSKLSTTCQSLNIASQDFEEGRIFVIDSENLSTGSGLLALKACKARDEGKSAKQIYEEVQSLTKNVSTKFSINKLDYMKKGGRCSSFAAIFASLLHIHPILKMNEGKLQVYKKLRGPLSVTHKDMINELKNDMPNVDLDAIFITHSGMSKQEELDYVYNEVCKIVDKEHVFITRAGCVVSSHCGPDTLRILYIKK